MTQVIDNKKEAYHLVQKSRKNNRKIGFVPTMGCLHEGHLTLMKKALSENDEVWVSIFVNPAQFNDPKDFSSYPRQMEDDLRKLKSIGVDYAFIPDTSEMYPKGTDNLPKYDLGHLENTLEGKHRPGHFQGVAYIVEQLFQTLCPHQAYFGLKDYQQYLIIKKMVENQNIDTKIVGVETVRESDGLAKSSRNLLLKKSEKKDTNRIFAHLKKAEHLLKNGSNPSEIEVQMTKQLNEVEGFHVEYFALRNASDLSSLAPAAPLPSEILVCTAVQASHVRLIDNIVVKL